MLTEPEAKAAIAAYRHSRAGNVVATSPRSVETAARPPAEERRTRSSSSCCPRRSRTNPTLAAWCSTSRRRRPPSSGARRSNERVTSTSPNADIEGFAVQPMVVRKQAQELILGISRDPIFGPVVLFGAGGAAVEVVDDTAIALPPLDDVLAADLIDRTRISRLLAGYRDRKPADRKAICLALNGLSQMIVDFPCIVSMDINPLLADSEGVIALDARIEIDPKDVERVGPNPDLAIRPYPADWNRDISPDGDRYHIRPIKPADVSLYAAFLAKVTPEDLRLRFFSQRKSIPHQMLLRAHSIGL